MKNDQLVIKLPQVEKNEELPDSFKELTVHTIPIEDIGVVVLDHKQITITQGLMESLLANNCAVITCDKNHLPVGLHLPLCGNTVQSERFRQQLDSSLPLRKQLWQQTVQQKIYNQARVLETCRSMLVDNMMKWRRDVLSGDSSNLEGRAAVFYWKNLFPNVEGFNREREGIPPNNMLNYGYAILRAVIARSLVASGLLPTLGIHHHNRYNAYCLADDIMEPYRPYVDELVLKYTDKYGYPEELSTEVKKELLGIPVVDVVINGQRSPLMIAATQTTASLARCFSGESRKIAYPEI